MRALRLAISIWLATGVLRMVPPQELQQVGDAVDRVYAFGHPGASGVPYAHIERLAPGALTAALRNYCGGRLAHLRNQAPSWDRRRLTLAILCSFGLAFLVFLLFEPVKEGRSISFWITSDLVNWLRPRPGFGRLERFTDRSEFR